jgi:hypothetical protein
VEFYVESGEDGRTKAVQVTGPGGAPPQASQLLVFTQMTLLGFPCVRGASWLKSRLGRALFLGIFGPLSGKALLR